MDAAQRTRWVCDRALEVGFDLCGVAPVDGFAELEKFPGWLARGYAGEMAYLHDARRHHPRLVLEDAQSVIVVALNYNTAHGYSTRQSPQTGDRARGWISRYAWGDDYHEVIKAKLDALLAAARAEFSEPFEARVYVDTGPILERVAAKYAGLGWLAKNTCLINPRLGSWLFLGVIVSTLALAPTLAAGAAAPDDLCGTCTRCLDACPTRAFPEPYVLDARQCISYLTIELRAAIPESLRASMGNAVIGCDICQEVCPWNRKAPVTSLAAFAPRSVAQSDQTASFFAPELGWLASLTQQQFSAAFRNSAAKRAKWRGLVRNACVALGNSALGRDSREYAEVVRLLETLAHSNDAVISEHARWALGQLGPARNIAASENPAEPSKHRDRREPYD